MKKIHDNSILVERLFWQVLRLIGLFFILGIRFIL